MPTDSQTPSHPKQPGNDPLAHVEQRLAAHFTRTPLASIEWNLDRTARLWNPAAEKIFGYTAAEAAERDLFPALVAPESRAAVDRVWQALLTSTGGEAATNTNITKDGRTILCRWYNTPIIDDHGNVLAVASLAEDITQRELAERKLRESERRLRSIIDRLPVLVWALDHHLRPAFWNEHARGVTGIEPSAIIDATEGAARIFPADASHLASLVSADFDDVERPIHCADGSVRRVLWSNVAARCPVPGWNAWGVGIDVTELRRATLAARESERRFREVFHTVELAGVLLDPQGRIIDCNDAMLTVLETPRDDLVGGDWFEVGCPPEDRDHARAELVEALSKGNYARRHERPIISPSGRVREMIWTRSLLRNADGRPVAACAFGLDVTQQRKAEAELTRHRDRLEQIVAERTEALAESTRQLAHAERLAAIGQLAAGVGHDIDNILLPVRCHLDTIAEDPAPEVAAAADAISSGLTVLARLAESLRSLTAVDPLPRPGADPGATSTGDTANASLVPTAPPLDLREWWTGAGPLVLAAIPDHVDQHVQTTGEPMHVRVEGHRLTQAVLNLVINAGDAFTPDQPGRIEISITQGTAATPRDGSADKPSPDRAIIRVTDTGRGMPQHVRARAVEPFFSTKPRAMSTGLGLSIVHAFVTAAGGDLHIHSEEGHGSTITIELPITPPADAMGDPANWTRTAAISIADPRTRAIHESVLANTGWTITAPDSANPPDIFIHDNTQTGDSDATGNPANYSIRVVSDADSQYPHTIHTHAGLATLKHFYSQLARDLQPEGDPEDRP